MRHLNYSHLQYFWTVAREGSIARASTVLHLTPQTISGQLKLLDEAVGQPLFNRVGRRLQPRFVRAAQILSRRPRTRRNPELRPRRRFRSGHHEWTVVGALGTTSLTFAIISDSS